MPLNAGRPFRIHVTRKVPFFYHPGMPFRQTRFSFTDGDKRSHALTLVEGDGGQQGAALLDGRWIVLRVLAGEGRSEYRNGTLEFHLKSDRWGTAWTLRCAERDFPGTKVDVLLQESVLSRIEKGPANELFQGENPDTILRRHGWKSHEGGDVEQAGPSERTLHETVDGMESRPVVSWSVLGLNVLIYFAMAGQGVYTGEAGPHAILDWGAEYAPYVLKGQVWRMLTAMFLHGSFFHLFSNMVALWAAGPFVERMVGRTGFLSLYLVSGLFGSVVSVYDYMGAPALGASGAIFGVLGALVGLMVRYHVYVRRRDLWKYVLLVVLLLVQTVMQVVEQKTSTRGGVDVAAHMGGLVSGLVIGLLMSRPIAASRRGRRDAIVAVVGLALVAGLTALRPPVIDTIAIFEEIEKGEAELLSDIQTTLARLRKPGGTNREAADAFDKVILPKWAAATGRFEDALRRGPAGFRKLQPRFSDAIRLQHQGLALASEAVRKNDESILKVALDRFKASDEQFAKMTKEATH